MSGPIWYAPLHWVLNAVGLQFGRIMFAPTDTVETDADIREYFFSLTYRELRPILIDHKERYGGDADGYLRKWLPKWRARSVRVPEHIEKRLFDLLPPRMPARKKLELADNVWRRLGPKSQLSFVVEPETDADELAARVGATLDRVEDRFRVSRHIRNRFKWLEAGDGRRGKAFLQHYRRSRRDLAVQCVKEEVPRLQRKYADERKYEADLKASRRTRTVIRIDGHVIVLRFDGFPSHLDGFPYEDHPEHR